MNEIALYILQANLFLAVAAVVYRYLLSNDTFFSCRRLFLLLTIGASFVYQSFPALVTMDFREEQVVDMPTIIVASKGAVHTPVLQAPIFGIEDILSAVWLVGSFLLIVKFMIGLCAVLWIRYKGEKSVINGTTAILVKNEVIPFSFYNWIFISKEQIENKDIEDIITHEKAHVKGFHTFDVLVGECLVLLFWFNPAVWYYKYAIKENLEFLADRGVLDCGHNRKNYQYKLLRLSCSSPVNNLINYFNVSQLQNRIIMMNKTRTSNKSLFKYGLTIAALMLLTVTNNAQTPKQAQTQKKVQTEIQTKKDTLRTQKTQNTKKPVTQQKSIVKVTPKEKITTKQADRDLVESTVRKDTISIIHKLVKDLDSKYPLVIIDGKESNMEKLSKMDIQTISSMTILKDQDAQEKYGEKAKNGVIVVEIKATKKAQK